MRKLLALFLLAATAFATPPPIPSNTGFVTTLALNPSDQPAYIHVDGSGNLLTTGGGGGGGGTSSTFGAAFPSSGTALGISDGTNMVALLKGQATMANSLPVAFASNQSALAVTGTFFQATQPVSIAAAISANLASAIPAGANVIGGVTQSGSWTFTSSSTYAQGSTTSGQSGPLHQGAVTTAAPTYSNGTTNPFSMNTAGGLRVDPSGVTSPVSAASLPLPSGAATAAKQPALGTAGAASADVLTVQGAASMTALASNITQVAGATVAQGHGTAATALRVELPTDGTGVVGLAAGANTIGALTANQSVNQTQLNGVAVSVGLGASDTGTQRFVQDTDQYFTGQSAQTATVNNIIPASSGASATDLTGFQSGSIQVVSTGTAGTFIFEGSNDNSNFQTVPVYSQLVTTGTPIVASITASSSNLIYVFPVTFRYLRLRIATTITGGSIQAFSTFKHAAWAPAVTRIGNATAGDANVTATIASGTVTTVSTVTSISAVIPSTGATNLGKAINNASGATDTGVAALFISKPTLAATAASASAYDVGAVTKYRAQYNLDQEKNLPTYRASTAAGGIALVASATDIAILPGNATNTVYVTKIIISGVQTTAGEVLVNVIKRSAANTSGTSAAMTSVPMDSGDAAASSLPLSYTANPTPGATVGIVDSTYVSFSPAATGTSNGTYTFNYGERGKGVKLTGTAQGVAVNLNGVTVTGGNAVITYEWREEP